MDTYSSNRLFIVGIGVCFMNINAVTFLCVRCYFTKTMVNAHLSSALNTSSPNFQNNLVAILSHL